MSANQHDIAFSIKIADSAENHFKVVDFQLEERLSELFVLTVTVACTINPKLQPATMIDKMATLKIHHKYKHLLADGVYTHSGIDVPVRECNGVIESVEYLSASQRWTMLKLTIMPSLHRLRHSSDCRIFQHITVRDIVATLLQERGINDVQFYLRDACHQVEREFCVQYNESHLIFIQRLLAEEGIFYYFKHEAGKHRLVITDITQGGAKLKPAPLVEYHHQEGGMIKGQYISQFGWHETLRPSTVKQRDYCFKHPFYTQHHEEFRAKTPHDRPIPSGYDKFYAHARYKEDVQGKFFTQYQLESERADASVGSGESNLIHFSAGTRFTLTGHKHKNLNNDYALISVSHQGTQPQALENDADDGETTYNNQFTVTPEVARSWRPPKYPKPMIRGSQIAHVVGPANEEIYTDEYGRVKLHFPWDRYSQKNEKSSCWVRVSQAWAGTRFGGIAVPRIGHEVIVDFIEGDPDQPIVIGRTYHAVNPHPYDLPTNKTQTGLLTRSSKKGHGGHANQLRFEDLKDQEQIYLHAERNQDNVVELDETTQVGRDRTENIGRDEAIAIGHDRRESVGHDESLTVARNQDNTIGHDQTHRIGRNRVTQIGKDEVIDVDNHRKLDVHADQLITTGGHYSHDVKGKCVLKAGEKIKEITMIYRIGVDEKWVIKGAGGSIILDSGGITLKGKVMVKGMVAVTGGSDNGEGYIGNPNVGKQLDKFCMQQTDGSCPLSDCPCGKNN